VDSMLPQILTLERRVREASSTRDLGMQPQYAWTLKQNSGRVAVSRVISNISELSAAIRVA
jgi:hypothetical protein